MTQVTETIRTDAMPCPFASAEQDNYCDNTELVEIEREGDHEFFECQECGSTWGHRIAQEVGGVRITAGDDYCEAGIDPAIRRRAAGERMQPVGLGDVIPIGPSS